MNIKKTLSIILATVVGFWGLKAQNTILNSDFELWSYGKPVGWTVGLHGNITSIINLPVEVNFGTQSNEAHSGNSSVKLQSGDFTIPYTSYSFNLPGILQAGESEGFNIPLESILTIINILQDSTSLAELDTSDLEAISTLSQLLSNGVPCSVTPTAINAWVKYQPQEGDQLVMIALTKKNRIPVSYTYGTFQPADMTNFHEVSLTLDKPGEECDSLMLIILSSMQLNSSSILYVDDIALDFSPVSILSLEAFPGKIFPNPATDLLHIQLDNDKTYEWTLTDLSGKTLLSGKATGETVLDTKSFASGMYLLQIRSDNNISTCKVLVR
jgi:hypothetical protein